MKQHRISLACLLMAMLLLVTSCGAVNPASAPEESTPSNTTAVSADATDPTGATSATDTTDPTGTTTAVVHDPTKATAGDKTPTGKTTAVSGKTTASLSKEQKLAADKKALYDLMYYLSYKTENYAIGAHLCGSLKVNDIIARYKQYTKIEPAYIDFDMNDLPFVKKQADIDKAVSELKAFVDRGGFVALTDHWVVPTKNISRVARGGAQNCRVQFTHQQYTDVMTPGTDLYKNFTQELDIKVKFVKQLQDAGIPVIYRPVHEMDGDWFWWCRNGIGATPQDTAALFRFVHDYFESRGLKNILWEFCTAFYANETSFACYPGDNYVDILGVDWYVNDGVQGAYTNFAQKFIGRLGTKPMVIAEFGGDGSSWPETKKPLKDTLNFIEVSLKNLKVPLSMTGLYFDINNSKVDMTPSKMVISLSDMPSYWAKVR